VTSRLKIMADLDIAERRLPQDGRIRRNFRGRTMDFRVSTLPNRHGEKVVLRLLDSMATQLGLDTLITNEQARTTLRSMGSKPFGMILVTGPTGSGKSTTLYALLSERNDPGINICTVEDPIEYTLTGISQTQARLRRTHRRRIVLHLRYYRPPQGCDVFAQSDCAECNVGLHAGRAGIFHQRYRVAGRADVPYQRLVHSLWNAHDRRSAGVAWPAP
jgi:hypothetical protein